MLAAAENVWTWYTRITKWFQENDLANISETALVLGKGLPKNDNDISSTNCVCCVTLLNQKRKVTASTTNVRRKRPGRHCLYRHCSGIVCAEKMMKKRKYKQPCAHLRVTQDILPDYWKICSKTDDNETENHAENVNIIDVINSDTKNCEGIMIKSKEKETSTKLYLNKIDSKQKTSIDCPCVSVDYNASQASRYSETKCKETQCFDNKSDKAPQRISELEIVTDICADNDKYSLQRISGNTSETQRKSSLCKITEIFTDEELIENVDSNIHRVGRSKIIKKQSQSDTSFSETIITDNCIDSILYRELRKKCASMIKKKLSMNRIKPNVKSRDIQSHRESDIDTEIVDFINDAQTFSTKQRGKYNSKRFENKHRSISKLHKLPTAWRNSAMNHKKKFHCESCCCDIKSRAYNCNDPQWKTAKKEVTLDREIHCAKYKPQFLQHKEKPTTILFKNKRSSEQRCVKESKFENSTDSACSPATTSTQFTERSVRENRFICRCSPYESLHYAMAFKDRCKQDQHKIGRSLLLSSSSSLTSSKRCHSWTALSQDSARYKREPISSSSCTNIQKCKRKGSRNAKRTSSYPSSNSSSTSLVSLSTYKKSNDFGRNQCLEPRGNIRESIKSRRLWRRPRFRKQEKKKTIYVGERHITWDVKRAY
ncbi:uncharacterized protein LOC128894000 isoform X2 [Hylaeus anthracinus]|uniref:uncharacterized protein LOC128894000 isoform X2 n=1 Tax=Hylaeus anthracinus TaxID=313031 RepID=UPI0023BA0810|nr:uncharacterized protein LOC128894000 isoform X2 [Hylaeus anthracinus]